MFREMPDPMDIVNPQILPVQPPVQAPVQPPVQTSQPTPSSPTTAPVTTSPVASQGMFGMNLGSIGLPSGGFSGINLNAGGGLGFGSVGGFDLSQTQREEIGNEVGGQVSNFWEVMENSLGENWRDNSKFSESLEFNQGQDPNSYLAALKGSNEYQTLYSNLIDSGTSPEIAQTQLMDYYGLGLSSTEIGTYGGTRQWRYDTETGEYVVDEASDNLHSAPSNIERIAPVAAMSIMTAGLGTALAPAIGAATGLGTVASTAIGTGIGSGVSTALQGGDLGDVVISGVTSGLGSYASGLTEAASAVDASQAVIEQANLVNNISNVVDIAQAVESGNILGAVSAGLDLAGSTGIELMVDDFFYDNFGEYDFVTDNLNAISDATIAFADAQLSGDNLEETLMATMKQYIESDGGLPDIGLGGEGFDFDLGINFTRPEWLDNISFGDFEGFGDFDTSQLRALGDYILAGASEINREVIRPVIDGVEQIARDTGTAIDQAVRDLPLTQQQIQDAERAARDFASGINENTIQPLIDTTAEAVRETGRDIREAIPDVDITNPIDIDINNPFADITNPLEGLENPFSGVDIDLPSVDLDLPSLGGSGGRYSVDADLSGLAKMKTQYGDMYDFEDIMSNNLLKNQLLA